MLLTKEVKITCRPSNKKHLESKGYKWQYNKIINVKTADLSKGSNVYIKVLCDYCLEQGKLTEIEKSYKRYLRDNINAKIKKDCCNDCVEIKRQESLINTYGVNNANKVYSIQDKDISKFNNLFEEKCVEPLVKYYRTEHDLLPFRCLKHNEIELKSIQRLKVINYICNKCLIELRSELFRSELDVVYNEYRQNGLIVLDINQYINFTTPLECVCIDHPEMIQYINRHQANREYRGCDKCKEQMKIGDNNPNWKGGITPENHKIRNSDEYKEWRSQVFDRDKYTCQCCGDKSGHNLVAHHILNFSSNKDLRLEINNGITLCSKCHNANIINSFHYLYGTKNNTLEQLKEYIIRYKSGEFHD